jgi:hypothetical protein
MMKDEVCPIFDVTNFFNRKWILCIMMDMSEVKIDSKNSNNQIRH